jgi:pimeloyl-ACP methyl ester carboxylesterase
MTPQAYAAQASAIATHDAEARLGALTAKTLVIGGDRDELIVPANFAALASRLPNAALTLLPGVAHMFWAEAPDLAESAIRAHLS